MLGYLSQNVLYNSDRLHRTNPFCLCTFQLKLTQSFFPDICRLYSSSSQKLQTRLRVSCGSVLPFFLAQVLPEFHQLSLIHEQFESNIPSYQIVLMRTLVTTASCSCSNSAFHCKSLSSKTESEVSSISLLTFYSPAMVLLHVSTTFSNFCLMLVCSTTVLWYTMQIYWRHVNHFQTRIETFSWCLIHFTCYIIQSVLINVIHWILLHLCVRVRKHLCIDDKACDLVEHRNFLL